MIWIIKILWIYGALMLAAWLHELGHLPEKITFKKWRKIPLPVAAAIRSRSRYGGLIATFLVFLAVYWMQTPYAFIQLLGAITWLHFILYTFFGSFNYEPKIPKTLWKYWVFDDVPNELRHIFVPMSIITFLIFQDFYLPIILGFLGG